MIFRHLFIVIFFQFCSLGSARAVPADFIFNQPVCAKSGDEIIAEGKVEATGVVTLVLRLDDRFSFDYASRVNVERMLPGGKFHWHVPLDGLKTSRGAPVDSCAISRIMLFVGAGEGTLSLDKFEIAQSADFSKGIIAYDLGPEDSPLMAGFKRLSAGDSALSGAALHDIARPGPDALIADGVSGIERVYLALPKGAWRLTLWTEDPGEWESLPHPYARKFVANSKVILDETLSVEQWMTERYLKGRMRRFYDDETPWHALGRHRGGRIQTIVDVEDRGLSLALSGDSPQAGFIAALVLEPLTSHFADDVEKQRERDFNEMWRIVPLHETAGEVIHLKQNSAQLPVLTLAKGTGTNLVFAINSADWAAGSRITLDENITPKINAMLWQAIPQLVRVNGGSTALTPTTRHLFATPSEGVTLAAGTTKLVLRITAGMTAGTFQVPLKIIAGKETWQVTVPVEVLNITLPSASKPSGFYLDEAPHVLWGKQPTVARNRQLTCDLIFLNALTITGNAPAISTPTSANIKSYMTDVERAKSAHIALPALAYAPAKRLYALDNGPTFVTTIIGADILSTQRSQTQLVWSLVDEPSNIGGPASGMLAFAPELKAKRPSIRLAGHFNAKGDEKYASALETILVNPGFGVDPAELALLPQDKEVWLYNMEDARLASGLFLHSSRATRYVQWHARMPTADPFDPTDGREDDFQMFLPSLNNCPVQPDVNQTMLDMADGLLDQRWLQWLDNQTDPDGLALSAKWKTIATKPWVSFSHQPDIAALFRDEVLELAQQLNSPD